MYCSIFGLPIVALVCKKDLEDQIMEVLRENGFTESVFKDLNEVPTAAMKRMQEELAEAHKEISQLAGEIEKDAKLKEKIEEYYDVTFLEAEKQKNRGGHN